MLRAYAGACLAIDDRYEVWESGFISIPCDFQLKDLQPRLLSIMESTLGSPSHSRHDDLHVSEKPGNGIKPSTELQSSPGAEVRENFQMFGPGSTSTSRRRSSFQSSIDGVKGKPQGLSSAAQCHTMSLKGLDSGQRKHNSSYLMLLHRSPLKWPHAPWLRIR